MGSGLAEVLAPLQRVDIEEPVTIGGRGRGEAVVARPLHKVGVLTPAGGQQPPAPLEAGDRRTGLVVGAVGGSSNRSPKLSPECRDPMLPVRPWPRCSTNWLASWRYGSSPVSRYSSTRAVSTIGWPSRPLWVPRNSALVRRGRAPVASGMAGVAGSGWCRGASEPEFVGPEPWDDAVPVMLWSVPCQPSLVGDPGRAAPRPGPWGL